MFELKPLSPEGVAPALEKALRYRLLNEPRQAESICRDIIAVDPKNRAALTNLILALTDQLTTKGVRCGDEARSLLPQLEDEYEEAYYAGIIYEGRAKAQLGRQNPGSGFVAHDLLHDAMECYEKAEQVRPAGNDDAILRWNTCARLIMESDNIRPHPEDDFQPLLE